MIGQFSLYGVPTKILCFTLNSKTTTAIARKLTCIYCKVNNNQLDITNSDAAPPNFVQER